MAVRCNARVLVLLTDELSHVLVRGQLALLTAAGFEVHVGVGRWHPAARTSAPFDEGAIVHDLPFRRDPSLIADVRALGSTIALIRRLRPHIVNASTPKAGLLGLIAARSCSVPVRVHVLRGLRSETLVGWKARAVRMVERLTVALSTHVLVNSASLLATAERLRVLHPGRGEVLGNGSGNGLDLDLYSADRLATQSEARRVLNLEPDDTVVGFVGRLAHDKGICDLIAAVDSIADGRVHLLLVGPIEDGDPLPEAILQRITDGPQVTHIPWLDDPRIAYAAMDILAFPSLREGLPNAPLEAQACGVPVVGYAATGTVDAVRNGHTGILVPVGDVAALRRALNELLTKPDVRRQLGEAGREWVTANFDRAVVAQALADKYRQWLHERGVDN